ncbi:MAG: hypothetical protein AB1556_11760 [Bacillota bacterium]
MPRLVRYGRCGPFGIAEGHHFGRHVVRVDFFIFSKGILTKSERL